VELFRAGISRLSISETSSPELGELSQGLVDFHAQALVDFCGKLRDWWFFHPPFHALGPWVRMGSPSWLQATLTEAPTLWGCSERLGRRCRH